MNEAHELDDRWILPFAGRSVLQIQVDFGFGLLLDGGCAVRFYSPATLGSAGGGQPEVVLDPETQEVAAGLALFGTTVESAVALKTGALHMEFTDGRLLRVAADAQYEAWIANGPEGLVVVSTPGGELAVWSAKNVGPAG